MSITYPFVEYDSEIVSQGSDTPIIILTAPVRCILDSIKFTNTTKETINVYVTLSRPIVPMPPTPPTENSIFLVYYQPVEINESRSFLIEDIDYLRTGDYISVFSDAATSLFDCILSYRKLNELTS